MGTKRCLRTTMSVLLCVVFAGGFSQTWARTVYVDDDAAGAQDGTSWASAFRYLQDALAVASAGDEVRVAQGTYPPDRGGGNGAGDHKATFRVPDSVTIKGGFASVGAPDPDSRDSALFATILTGDLNGNDDPNDQSILGDNSFHVVTADGVSSDTVLDGLRIAYGEGDAGGGLRNIGASPIVRDCTFFRNRANEGGGGVMNTDSNAVFVGCTFLENWCGDGEGGGMENHRSHIRIEDCRFIRNYADDDGGGLSDVDGSSEVINCEFLENSASECGGGVSAGHATFFNCVFRANSGGEGAGAISGGDVRLILCRFLDNIGWERVGGVACGDMVAINCTFANNSGEEGGAILARSGCASLKHCTFWGNIAGGGRAGGIYCESDCSLNAHGCIFWANRGRAGGGGAITGYRAQLFYGYLTTSSIEYCCIEGWIPDRGGTGNIGDEPLFVAPDAGDFHLKSQAGHWDAVLQAWVPDDVTSPCIDAGDPLTAVEHELFPNGGIVNMGAYGGTCEASKSWFGTEPCPTVNAADINGDCRVDAEDYRLTATRWLQPAIGP